MIPVINRYKDSKWKYNVTTKESSSYLVINNYRFKGKAMQ